MNDGHRSDNVVSGNATSTMLPLTTHTRKSSATESTSKELRILCFELTHYNKTTQFLLACAGIFVLYLLYGYLQELIFTLESFKPYGWFLTLLQFFYYIIFGVCERQLEAGSLHNALQRCIPMRTYVVLAALTLGTMGLSNSSLGYLNYPTQVIFKCCKLIPVLIGSMLIQGKRYGPLDFAAAIAMCVGLAWFTLVDSQISPKFDAFGVLVISLALLCDAAIGNVQEKAMREYKAPSSEVVLFSYGLGFIYLFAFMLCTGQFTAGLSFCLQHPRETFGYGFLFSLSGYLGIQFVLALVRSSGAAVAATVTTARKAVSIAISFVLFSKPFTMQYVWSGLVVVLGIYLSVYSKKHKLTFQEMRSKCLQYWRLFSARNKSKSRLLSLDV